MGAKRPWLLAGGGLVVAGAAVAAALVWAPPVVLAWAGGVLAAALVAYLGQEAPRQLGQALGRRRERRRQSRAVPVTCTARIGNQDYVLLTDEGTTVEVPASGHTVQVVVTGAAPAPVVLSGLRVEVLSRFDRGGDLTRHAAEVPVRRFEVLLDEEPPRVRALTASDFPYQVGYHEIEVFDLLVSTEAGDVRWVLWLDWSTDGRTGSLRVDLGGQAFRTAARHGLPA